MKRKTGFLIYSILSVLFVFFCMTEGKLAEQGNILWTGKWIAKLSVICLILGTVLGSVTSFILYKIEDILEKKQKLMSKESKKQNT